MKHDPRTLKKIQATTLKDLNPAHYQVLEITPTTVLIWTKTQGKIQLRRDLEAEDLYIDPAEEARKEALRKKHAFDAEADAIHERERELIRARKEREASWAYRIKRLLGIGLKAPRASRGGKR